MATVTAPIILDSTGQDIVDQLTRLADAANPSSLNDLSDVAISSPADGQVLMYDNVSSKFENKELGEVGIVRFAGSNSLSDLITNSATYLTSNYEDKFFRITTGGTLDSSSAALFVSSFQAGDVISTDQHIAVINIGTAQSPNYKYDDFGGYVDVSGLAEKNVVTTTRFSISTTGWTADSTSQSGVTLYKKSVSLNHIYKNCPDISIGAAAGLPSTAEQEAYDLLKYVTVDDTIPCLYLYASAIPTNGFYINAEGVD